MMDPKPWREIPHEEAGEAICVANKAEDRECDQQAQITQEDQVLVFLLVEWTGRQEVIDTSITVLLADTLAFRLLRMIVMTGDIDEDVA